MNEWSDLTPQKEIKSLPQRGKGSVFSQGAKVDIGGSSANRRWRRYIHPWTYMITLRQIRTSSLLLRSHSRTEQDDGQISNTRPSPESNEVKYCRSMMYGLNFGLAMSNNGGAFKDCLFCRLPAVKCQFVRYLVTSCIIARARTWNFTFPELVNITPFLERLPWTADQFKSEVNAGSNSSPSSSSFWVWVSVFFSSH